MMRGAPGDMGVAFRDMGVIVLRLFACFFAYVTRSG